MKLRRPSPAMVVALVALVMASTGTAVAAVNFAQNAGAVDGKSAVRSSVTRSTAAGRLVATASRGLLKGRIPGKFLDLSAAVRGHGDAPSGSRSTSWTTRLWPPRRSAPCPASAA